MNELSYLHFELLRVASQRINCSLLPCPMILGDFTAVQVRRAISDLIANGFVAEVCNPRLPSFRTEGFDGIAVVITDLGRTIVQDSGQQIETVQSLLLALLMDGSRFTLSDMAGRVGGASHQVRAALMGLRKKGFDILCERAGRCKWYWLGGVHGGQGGRCIPHQDHPSE